MAAISRLRRAALVATALALSGCLEVPPEVPDPSAPSAPPGAGERPDAALDDQRLACDEAFGAAAGYELCSETESTCSFFSKEDGSTFECNERCAEFDATCVSGFDAPGYGCTPQTEDGCAYPHNTQICVCLRR